MDLNKLKYSVPTLIEIAQLEKGCFGVIVTRKDNNDFKFNFFIREGISILLSSVIHIDNRIGRTKLDCLINNYIHYLEKLPLEENVDINIPSLFKEYDGTIKEIIYH